MAWTYRIKEINRPMLLSLEVLFEVLRDGSVYAADSLTLTAEELSALTAEEQRSYILSKVAQRVEDHVKTSGTGLEDLLDQQFPLTTPKSLIQLEVEQDPLGRGYSSMTREQILADLNTKYRSYAVAERFVSIRTLLAECDPVVAATITTKFEVAAETNKVIELALRMLNTFSDGGGIDIAHPSTIAFIDQMVAGGVLTAEEGETIKSMADRNRANELLGRDAVLEDVPNVGV